MEWSSISPFALPFSSFANVLVICGLASILAFLSYGAYNLFFHPLARFPGPPLFCAYYFPFVYLHCTGKVPSHVQSWHATYGPVVRINPNELAFSSPQAWDDIYGLLPGRRQNLKDRWSYHPDQKGILTASTSEHHRKRRAVLAPSFAPKALEEQQALFATFVEKLVNGLHKRIAEGDDVQDLGAWYNWVTFDFNGAFSFGESFQCLEKEEYHPWLKTLLHGLTIGIMLSQLERYGLYSLMVMILPESVFADKHKMNTFAKQHVDTRLAETRAAKVEGEWAGKQADRSDLFRYLLEKGDGPGDSREDMEDLYGDCIVLVIAGSETTATMLTACTWYLLSSRTPSHDAYARAVAEVRTAFKTTKPEDEKTEITAKAVEAKCPYLVAVLQEALRIFPPVPVGMPRTIGADDGQLVDGVFLPKGTAASVHQLPAGTSPRNFTRPLEFLPERWLSGDKGSEEFQTDKFGARQPFSCGPRNCIGQTLAHVEMRLLLARMLLNFDFELAPGRDMETWRDRCRPFTVWHKPPMLVRLKPADR